MSSGIKSFIHYLETSALPLPEVTQSLMTGSQILLAYQKLTDLDSRLLSLSERLQQSVEILSETLGFAIVVLDLYDAKQHSLQFQAGTICLLPEGGITSQPVDPLSEQALRALTPIAQTDEQGVTTQTNLAPYLSTSVSVQTIIQLPLVAGSTVVGILSLASSELFPAPDSLCPWLKNLASYLAWFIQAEQGADHLAQAESRLTLAATSVEGCFYDWDLPANRIIQFANGTGSAARPTQELTHTAWINQIHADDRPIFESLIATEFEGQEQFEIEYRLQVDDQIVICDRGLIQRDLQGRPTRVVGTLLDISKRKQADITHQQQLSQYQSFLSEIQVVVFQTDQTGNWTYLNPAWAALTKYSVEDSLGHPMWEFVHPDDRRGLQEAFQSLVDRTKTGYHHELRYLSKQGGCCWLEIHSQVLQAEDGSCVGTAGTLVDVTERKQAEQELLHDALHDGLTDLPNRILFTDRLQQACRSFQRHPEEIFAVLFLDLDRFKIINDTLGHLVGDQLLMAVAHRLQACLRPEDTVARLGGDEFTVLLPNIERVEDAIHISDRILQTLSASFTLDNTEVFISTSIGIAMSGSLNHQPEDLIRHADIALYRAKASGKGCYAVFTPELPMQPLAQVQKATELRQALEDEEFRLYCQPFLSLETSEVGGFTLQMYWQHPTKGLLPPVEFIHGVTESGLQASMSWWLLRKACQQLHQWQRIPSQKPLFIWVPASEPQLASSKFQAKFERMLAKDQINPEHLILELPDSLWPQPSEQVLANLKAVRSQGVHFARIQTNQDYDWLSTDLPLPIEWIKLSSSLLDNLNQQGYLDAIRPIFTLAKRSGIRMLADHLQTPKQHMLMSALKCDYGQGPHIAAALPAQAADPWLEPSFSQPLDNMAPSSMSLLIIFSPIGQSQVPLVGKRTWTIGRSPDNSIVLPDRWASRNHAQLRATETGEFYLIDLGSGNGSVVNGERVTMPVALKDGDLITIGHSQLEFHHRVSESALSAIETAPKNVLMVQSSHLQGQVWKEALSSQGISLTWLNENIDLAQYLTQSMRSGQGIPDLLLLDMTILKPNPYSFCRWCHNLHPTLNIILTSGTRTFVPASERKWATHQGASELIAAFDEDSIFSNLIDVMAKVRIVLATLNWRPIEQGPLSAALLAIKPNLSTATFASRQTIIGELPTDLNPN